MEDSSWWYRAGYSLFHVIATLEGRYYCYQVCRGWKWFVCSRSHSPKTKKVSSRGKGLQVLLHCFPEHKLPNLSFLQNIKEACLEALNTSHLTRNGESPKWVVNSGYLFARFQAGCHGSNCQTELSLWLCASPSLFKQPRVGWILFWHVKHLMKLYIPTAKIPCTL